jgi:branched-chain amino acid transport system substrate-binding protein
LLLHKRCAVLHHRPAFSVRHDNRGSLQSTFISEYQANGYNEPYGIFGPYSYDATWAIIEAVKQVYRQHGNKLPGGAALRQDIETATGSVSFSGLTGQVSFDSYGDARSFVITMNTVRKGQWASLGTVSTAGS